jgi:hypothetical protein
MTGMRDAREPRNADRTDPHRDMRDRVESLLGGRRVEKMLAATFFGVLTVILVVLAILWIELLVWILSWVASLLAGTGEASYTMVALVPEVDPSQGDNPFHARRSVCTVPTIVQCGGGQI